LLAVSRFSVAKYKPLLQTVSHFSSGKQSGESAVVAAELIRMHETLGGITMKC
jgi:hypothetical protein